MCRTNRGQCWGHGRDINDNKRYEVAFHGLTHGIPGHVAGDFTQEWKTFNSVKEAINQIEDEEDRLFFSLFYFGEDLKWNLKLWGIF